LGGCGAAPGEGESLGEGPSAGAGASDEDAAGVEGLDVGAEGHMDDGFAGCADAVVGADESEERAETGERRSAGGADRASGREIVVVVVVVDRGHLRILVWVLDLHRRVMGLLSEGRYEGRWLWMGRAVMVLAVDTSTAGGIPCGGAGPFWYG
jgi:hypothetical protein